MDKVIIRTAWTAAGLRRFEKEVNNWLDSEEEDWHIEIISVSGWLRHVCVAVLSKAENE